MKNLNRYFLIFKMGIFLLPRNSTSCDLFYVIRQWNKCRHLPHFFLKITFWPKLCFNSWALRLNNPLATFPWDRMERPGKDLKTRKKWFITLTSPLTNQLPAWPRTPNTRCLVIFPVKSVTYRPSESSGCWVLLIAFHSPGWCPSSTK